jgi:hypothetical protein
MELRRFAGMGEAVGENSFLARLPGIPTFKEMRAAFDNELRRSRRYERPLTALVIVPDLPSYSNGNGVYGEYTPARRRWFMMSSGNHSGNHSSNHDSNGSSANGHENGHAAEDKVAEVPSIWTIYAVQLRFLLLGSLLCGTLRESDVVSYAAEYHEFIALLPECDVSAARQAVERLHKLYMGRTRTGVRAGLAAFPGNGLTLDTLVEHARNSLSQDPIRPGLARLETNGVSHG